MGHAQHLARSAVHCVLPWLPRRHDIAMVCQNRYFAKDHDPEDARGRRNIRHARTCRAMLLAYLE